MTTGERRVAGVLLAGAIFAADLSTPLGVAGGVPYVAVVLLALGLPTRRETVYFALGCSVLTLFGLLFSPDAESTDLWKVFTNRALALFAIGVTAAVGLQRKRAQSELAGLGRILDDSLNEIYVFDAGTLEFLRVNRGARENLGYAMEELRGLTPLDLKPDFDRESLAEMLAPLRSGAQQTRTIATRHRRKDGTFYPVEVQLQLADLDSSPVFVAIALDTTERIEAERALLESERRLRTMVENLPAGAVYLEGDSIYLNRMAEEIIGYQRDEIRSLDEWFARLYDDRAGAVRAAYEEAREANFPVPRTHELTRKDGSVRLVEFSSYRHDVGDVWLLHDVTERARAQEELRKTEEGMRVAEQLALLGTLTAGVAHDVGTPMNVILGYAQMLESSESNEKNRERLRAIREQVQRVTALIQSLLNFARPRELMLASLDLAGELDTALSFLEPQFKKQGIAVDRRFEPVPAVRGDRDRLQQLFLNLCVNAADAMPDGGELRVTLRVGEPGKVEIRIADTGMGIPEESLESVFAPFFTTKDRGKGTGLGLLVSKRIVTDHGGAIALSSEVGKGTEFRILLPAADDSC